VEKKSEIITNSSARSGVRRALKVSQPGSTPPHTPQDRGGNPSALIKRWSVLLTGLFLEALGIVLSIHAELGVSPISSIPYLLNLEFGNVTVGEWTLAINAVFIIIQLILLKKQFHKKDWLQIPMLLVFSFFIDMLNNLMANVMTKNYAQSLLLIVFGTLALACGITLCCNADICLNTGEAVVKAFSVVLEKEFGKVKTLFDVTLVICTISLSFLFFRNIRAVREGTLIMAVCTGILVHMLNCFLKKPLYGFVHS